MLPIHTILHPTDFSQRAHTAFTLARSMARDYGARLIVAHIVPSPVVGFGQGVVPPPEELDEEELYSKLDEYVDDQTDSIAEKHLIIGDPSKEILKLAKANDVDLIVMGTHGWTGLGRMLMGSVAESVVRRANCPVLTIKTPGHDLDTRSELLEEVMGL